MRVAVFKMRVVTRVFFENFSSSKYAKRLRKGVSISSGSDDPHDPGQNILEHFLRRSVDAFNALCRAAQIGGC